MTKGSVTEPSSEARSGVIAISIFLLVVGVGIIGLWIALLMKRSVPEVTDGDRAIWFHLTAELMLGIALLTAGILLLIDDQPATRLLSGVALGGLVYSTINSSGYYAQRNQWSPIVGFAIITALALAGIAALVRL